MPRAWHPAGCRWCVYRIVAKHKGTGASRRYIGSTWVRGGTAPTDAAKERAVKHARQVNGACWLANCEIAAPMVELLGPEGGFETEEQALARELEEAVRDRMQHPLGSRGACFSSVNLTAEETAELTELSGWWTAGVDFADRCSPAARHHLPPLARRHARSSCFKCGGADHWVRSCSEASFTPRCKSEDWFLQQELGLEPAHSPKDTAATQAPPVAAAAAQAKAPAKQAKASPPARHFWGRRKPDAEHTHDPAAHSARLYGVYFHKADTRPGRRGNHWWEWVTPGGEWRRVVVEGKSIKYTAGGKKRSQRCVSSLDAESAAGVIAEELAAADPDAKRRRRYAFEPRD